MRIEIIRLAIDNIMANRLRAGLSALGIIIGVGSMIAVLSIIEMGRQGLMTEMNEMGADLLWVDPRYPHFDFELFPEGNESEFEEDITPFENILGSLKDADILAIKRQCSVVSEIAPEASTNLNIPHRHRQINFEIHGITPSYQSVCSIEVRRGRFINNADVSFHRKIAVIEEGKKQKRLFGLVSPLGKEIQLFGLSFKVVGLTKEKSGGFGMDGPGKIYIPLTTFQGLEGKRIDLAYIKASDVKKATEDVKAILNQRYKGKGFSVESSQDMIKGFHEMMTIAILVGGGIAAISLLVGGIGIANVMFVSVKERTREIGTLKAIGVKERDILYQFLIEAVSLCLGGGAVGIGLGLLIGKIFSYFAEAPFGCNLWIILAGFGFSTITGIISGILPARAAARLEDS
ncbi:ABC transporter permease [bacterium]|nr:ABC transporter permease [bacterium]